MTQTRTLTPDRAGIEAAATLLRAGELVAFPTETVYGLGADATQAQAVAAIFDAKGRPRFNPLIVHVPSVEAAQAIAHIDGALRDLAGAFWPGPLTLVAPLRSTAGVASLALAGNPTVAVRVPAHPLARELLAAVDRPVVAPSANRSGRVSATTAAHVLDGLDGRIAAVLDGGPCAVGLESTIVGQDAVGAAVVLRLGGLPVEAIADALGAPPAMMLSADRPNAPGQLTSHYAPAAALRMNAEGQRDGEVFIGFGGAGPADLWLDRGGDLHAAAARLFDVLRMADGLAAERGTGIAVAKVPEVGLGAAINDRLRRASAPRPASG